MDNSRNLLPSVVFDNISDGTNAHDIIKDLFKLESWYSYVDERLSYKEYQLPKNTDEDLDLLIDWYTNKNSKRVKYAGEKLRKVFLELPPVEQRKVGLALLTGGKTDTEWVCKRLDNYKPNWNKDWVVNWHPCYSDAVEDVWVRFKGKSCGKLLIQFLDKNIVQKHLDELLEYDELYFGLCNRFIHEDWFKFDKEKLARCTYINAYLSILSQTADGITDEEATRLLYQWIATVSAICKKKYSTFKSEKIFWRYGNEEHRVIYAWGMDTAIFYLLKMKKHNVIAKFLKWDQTVCDAYLETLGKGKDSEENQERFVDVILENIPDEYRYLSRLNIQYYNYASSPGQPFTTPRILEIYKREESWHSPYSEEPSFKRNSCVKPKSSLNDDAKNEQSPFASEGELEQFISENPVLQQLAEKLKLQPVILDDRGVDNNECPL